MPVPKAHVPRPLNEREIAALRPYIPREDLDSARLYEGAVPAYLLKRYIAIARGNRIYFRAGTYAPHTAQGLALLGHELVHVGQYRLGATWLSFLLSYARHGYRDSPLEVAARSVQERILRELGCGGLASAQRPVAQHRPPV